jgi:hypothetical protein
MIFIYTCKARINLALQVYDMLWNIDEKKFIVYGDKIEPEFVFEDIFLILKVGDTYEDLTKKTKKMFQVAEKVFPGEYILKMDDDIIPNNELRNHLLQKSHYVGCASNNVEHYSTHHIGKVTDTQYNIPMYVPSLHSAAGPMYYLSSNAIHLLNQSSHTFFYEDVTVGYCLNQAGIYPTDIKLYDDEDITKTFHNHMNHKKLYMKIHGGLGNQFFQVASAYGIAKKNNCILILVTDYEKETFPHQEEVDEYNKTFFQSFRIIQQKHVPEIPMYCETDNIKCFQHNEITIEKSLYIEGYLQNEKYFKEYRKDILALFKPYDLKLDSYFIHVRRGDYLTNPLHCIDLHDYYKSAIDYIESKNPQSHYYIVSDDIPYCKEYTLFDSLNKTFVEDTPMNTLSIMSSCKGGICSNSTFSWWGSYLIDREKIVTFPKKWIHNEHENDIYYEGSIVL